jgi:hypothetical protein
LTGVPNPYEPGRFEYQAGPGSALPFQLNPGQIVLSNLLREALAAFKKHWVVGSVATLLAYIISFGFNMIGQLLQTAGTLVSPEFGYIGIGFSVILSFVVSPVIYAGPVFIAINAIDNMKQNSAPVNFDQNWIGANGLVAAIALVPVLLGGAAIAGYLYYRGAFAGGYSPSAEDVIVISAIAIPVMAVVFYAAIRLFFVLYICVDQRTGPVESLRRSWQITDGSMLRLAWMIIGCSFLFIIAMIPYLIFAVLTCLIGLLAIFGIVFFYILVNAAAYRVLMPGAATAESQEPANPYQTAG